LRTRLRPEQTFLDVMKNARRVTTDAYTHQLPFHEIKAVSQVHNPMNDPLFRVSLVLRNIPFTEMQAGGLQIQLSPLELDRAVCEGDVSVYLQEVGGVLSGYFEYDNHIFHSFTANQLAADFVCLLEKLTSAPEARLSDLPRSQEPLRRNLASTGSQPRAAEWVAG
jgi:hypothetical protein